MSIIITDKPSNAISYEMQEAFHSCLLQFFLNNIFWTHLFISKQGILYLVKYLLTA